MPAIIAAVAPSVIGAVSSAASGSGATGASLPPGVGSSYSQTSTLPDWYTAAQQNDVINPAETAEGIATSNSENNYGADLLGFAQNDIAGLESPSLNQGAFDSYMDPYVSDVMNAIQQQGNENLMENVLPGVNSTFTGAGQFGSDRNGEFENIAIRNNQLAESQAEAQAGEEGFGQALTGYQGGMGDLATAAGLLQSGAQTAAGLQTSQIQNLLAPTTAINQMEVPTNFTGAGKAPLAGSTYGPSAASQLAGGAAAGLAAANNTNPSSSVSNINPATGNTLATDAAPGPNQVLPMRKGGLAHARRVKHKSRGGALRACA